MLTYEEIRKNEDIRTYIIQADKALAALGYTEHSFSHVEKVAETSRYILETLDFDSHQIELARIAAYLHDIGNLVNRQDHSQSGAVMAFRILDKLNMPSEDVSTIVSAIGNHDEGTGVAVNAVAAALIISDKTDVRRSRVRNNDISTFDIHDRVNYSVRKSTININDEKTSIILSLDIDTNFGAVMDYFEIFMGRMIMCRKAADTLGLSFRLVINGQQLL